MYARSASLLIFVYDTTNRDSFLKLDEIYKLIDDAGSLEMEIYYDTKIRKPIAIVGTKMDVTTYDRV